MTDKGAHFYRCDLQVHTPRDLNWAGEPCITEEERRAYALQLVEACRDRGIQGIAITDHHDMNFAEYVRQAAAEETDQEGKPLSNEQRLVVFPGMELTLGVPCQALILFDADFPSDLFSLATTALAITPNGSDEAKTAQTQRLDHIESHRQLRDDLDIHTYLRDHYIVLPNVTNEGKSSLLRTGLAGKYAEMPWVGGYVDGDITKLTDGIKNIIAGRDKNWGNKRIACFQTSDNRRSDHHDLGCWSTWIKWATPTAEALRQACLAPESRVSLEPPKLPSVIISSISVSNSAFLGPLDLEFNPQYNALIGGRGTGKSTVLEYLRWALCDQPPTGGDEDTPNYQMRRSRLIEQTLKPLKATVQVIFEVNGVRHTVRRNSEDGSILVKIADDELRPCSEEEARDLLPIQAYSQKQLSDVSVRVEELSRFITAPIRPTLVRIDRQLMEQVERVREAFAKRRRQQALEQALQKRGLEERSLSEQVATLRASLMGLSDEDRTLLDQEMTFRNADRVVKTWRDEILSVQKGAAELQETINSYRSPVNAPPAEPEGEILTAAHREYQAFLAEASSLLDTLMVRATPMTDESEAITGESPWHQWTEKSKAFRAAYTAALQHSTAHSQKLEQLQEAEDQLASHIHETTAVREELRALSTADSVYSAARNSWLTLLAERDNLLAQRCDDLTASSNGIIRGQLRRFADSEDFQNGLRQAVSGSRLSSSKVEGLADFISGATDPGAQWNAVLADLEKIAEFDVDRDGVHRRLETPTLSAAGFAAGDLDRISRSLKPEAWLSLALTPIRSEPAFEYRAREADYIPFRNASAGQQATALLTTLLNQPGPPLIIDQPEEDLDNPVILEIVNQVWQAKQRRQLIFSSHNANLVVNGDAELVAWCDYRTTGDQSRGMIAGVGAIDVPDVREAIKKIMEGGEAAFNLRKEKYGF